MHMARFQSLLLNNYSLKSHTACVCEREDTQSGIKKTREQEGRETARGREKEKKPVMGLLTQQVFHAQQRLRSQGQSWVPGPGPGRMPQGAQAVSSASYFPIFQGHVAVGGA